MSDVLAVVPWYLANADVVENSRSMLRVWVGGKYVELLRRLRADTSMLCME